MYSFENDVPFIYFGPCKTASSSIDVALNTHTKNPKGKHVSVHNKTQRFEISRHHVVKIDESSTCSLAESKIDAISSKNLKKVFKFASIRSPYDRIFSYFSYRKYGRDQSIGMTDLIPIDTFEVFIDWIYNNKHYLEEELLPIDSPLAGYVFDIKPMLDWISLEDGTVIIDEYVRFENLEDDWKKIVNEKLLLESSLLNHYNWSKRPKDYKVAYNDNIRKKVEKIYEKDLDYFKYTF